MTVEAITKPGEVIIDSLLLYSTKLEGEKHVITSLFDFFLEFNLYEDIFSNFLRGDIVISDSRNLIYNLSLTGEEYLIVKFRTPSFTEPQEVIEKTFRIVKISDRKIIRDNNTQIYILNFVSCELIVDLMLPIYKSFKGTIDEVVQNIFTDYLEIPRTFVLDDKGEKINSSNKNNTLKILTETSNKVQFVSPGWSAAKCINWLASKSIPKDNDLKACNFLFFESNKGFYYVSIETMYKYAFDIKTNIIGEYGFAAKNIGESKTGEQTQREYFLTEYIDIVENSDFIKNYTNGYLANRLITLDIFNKKYELVDYNHTLEYSKYYHTSGKGTTAVPIFANYDKADDKNVYVTPTSSINFYPISPKLFTNFENNIGEKIKDIYGNRLSNLLDLTNIKININIPGRTDIEVGSLIKLNFPVMDPSSDNTNKLDEKYSGNYLITAIRHTITKTKAVDHRMILEIIKDSLTS